MTLPRVRFTVRGMLVGVAAVASLLSCSLMVPRVSYYRQRFMAFVDAEWEFKRGRMLTANKSRMFDAAGDADLSRRYRALSGRYRLMEDWAREQRIKYERAMWWPWWRLPPDPPPPVAQL
jgi:hypothetical protein